MIYEYVYMNISDMILTYRTDHIYMAHMTYYNSPNAFKNQYLTNFYIISYIPMPHTLLPVYINIY